MALTLIKEDGTGKSDANSYASVADGEAYFEGHLYPTLWTAATGDQKAAALVMATRLIDAEFQFYGTKADSEQALQWPREDCPDPDLGDAVESSTVPKAIANATCEMAQELLALDRTAAPPGEGILEQRNTDYSGIVYSKKDTRAVLSRVALSMLAKFGYPIKQGPSTAKLVRV